MRGDVGTKVVITMERPGVEKHLDFEIVRDIIKIESIPYAFKLDSGIGYLRVRQFNANTTKEMRESLDKLEEEGIRGLLIDLRFNPGGLLREAVDTVNEFIGKDKRVVFTKGRTPETNYEYYTKYNRMRTGYPVVVLINEASASAAEIFAGSLQDWDKGLVVGKTSFGKGSVQRLFPLSDGNGIKITTAKYYINSGRCIHKDLNDKLLKGEDVSEEERKEADVKSHEDSYYTEEGRLVYGGGGVTPDIELEQSRLTKLGVELRRKNTIFDFSVNYMLDHEAEVTEEFEANKKLVDELLVTAKIDSIEFEEADVDSTYIWIENTLTSNIIGRKFGNVESYKVSIKEDSQLQKALKLFEEHNTLKNMFEYSAGLQKEEDKELEVE
jgi:carboxyl-terminal processing protease